jgi:hypothetical protein
MLWLESSLNDLYDSAVAAFPHTTKRQYATDSIKIVQVQWIPFLGMKTLFVKGLAQNEGREYNPIIVLKKVAYHEAQGPGVVPLKASDGETYFLERLSGGDTDVLVRCSCDDFRYRFAYYNHLDKSLQGPKPKKYVRVPGSTRPPANPQQREGLCKHLIKLTKILQESSVLS